MERFLHWIDRWWPLVVGWMVLAPLVLIAIVMLAEAVG